jgi:tRNA1Val (adenine37-N6)-methyltransferase
MPNTYFTFKTFTIEQKACAMKVTTDACLFGSWVADQLVDQQYILDIGGGTGVLSLMLAQKNKSSQITTVEIEASCFQQLSENIQQSIYASQINPVHQNILDFQSSIKFNTIISNPPFYENQLKSDKGNVNQARHEESLSLKKLFDSANRHLDIEGQFYVLLPYYRMEESIALAEGMGFTTTTCTVVHQTPAHQPFRAMLKFAKKTSPLVKSIITISERNGNYTEEFTRLLKDYYLHL